MSSENQVAEQEQQTVASEQPTIETKEVNWKDSLPEDLKNEKALESIQDIPGLAKSFIHAQKMVGTDKISIPNKHATDDDWNDVYSKLGRPSKPEDYQIQINSNSSVDTDALNGFKEAAHKYGLLPKQAEGIINFYDDMTQNYMRDLDAKAEQGRMHAEKSLKEEWGPAYDSKVKSVGGVVKKYLNDDFAHMTLSDGTKVGDHPDFIRAFANIASDLGEDKLVTSTGPQYMTPKEIDKQLRELQAEGSAYWKKNHPNHDAAVQEVQDLMKLKMQS